MSGSTSKSFTALAVMQLVDSGRVDLEAPVRDYVPELELDDPRVVQLFYLVVDLVAVLLLSASVWGLRRAVRTVASRSPPPRRLRGWVGVLLRSLGVGLLVLAPASSYGWSGLWTWAPDLAVVLAVLALLLAATTALRVVGLVGAWRTTADLDARARRSR